MLRLGGELLRERRVLGHSKGRVAERRAARPSLLADGARAHPDVAVAVEVPSGDLLRHVDHVFTDRHLRGWRGDGWVDGEVARYACAREVDSGTHQRIKCDVCHLCIGWLLALASRSSSAESIGSGREGSGSRMCVRVRGPRAVHGPGHETRGHEIRAR